MATKRTERPVPTDLSIRIKDRRTALHMSQATLGSAAGVTKSAVSQWENGDVHNLKLGTLYSIADKLQVRARWLALGELPMERLARDKIPQDAIDLAQRIAKLSGEKRALLMELFADEPRTAQKEEDREKERER